MSKPHLLGMSLPDLEALLISMGEPRFRGKQVQEWVFRHLETDFGKMTNLPKGVQEKLAEAVVASTLSVKAVQVSTDGTTKWALETHDGHVFETVLIPTEDRRSLCVSSQIGCAMGCTFCRTATMGFIRNLTLGEILEQVHFVNRHLKEKDGTRLSKVIFMGMGEPLLNLENVARAC